MNCNNQHNNRQNKAGQKRKRESQSQTSSASSSASALQSDSNDHLSNFEHSNDSSKIPFYDQVHLTQTSRPPDQRFKIQSPLRNLYPDASQNCRNETLPSMTEVQARSERYSSITPASIIPPTVQNLEKGSPGNRSAQQLPSTCHTGSNQPSNVVQPISTTKSLPQLISSSSHRGHVAVQVQRPSSDPRSKDPSEPPLPKKARRETNGSCPAAASNSLTTEQPVEEEFVHCQRCGYKNHRSVGLSSHKCRPYRCASPNCSYSAFSRRSLSRHHLVVHSGKRFQCPECQKSYLDKCSLNKHYRSVHEGIRFQCPDCGQIFSRKAYLDIHSRAVHKGIRYQCPECDQSFSRKVYLSSHCRAVHEGIRFQCPDCDRSFSTKQVLDKHCRAIHEGIRYQCPDCDQSFSQKHYLSIHSRALHKGIRFQCPDCDQSFSYKSNIKSHCRAVHEGIRYQCSECDKSFSEKRTLKRHSRAVHKGI